MSRMRQPCSFCDMEKSAPDIDLIHKIIYKEEGAEDIKFEMITPGQLDDYVGNSEALIIDLREPEEFVQRHIRGAVNIPYERFQERIMFPMDMELILYCERGSISISAARELSEKGYRVKTVVGGIHAYRGLNTVTDFNF